MSIHIHAWMRLQDRRYICAHKTCREILDSLPDDVEFGAA